MSDVRYGFRLSLPDVTLICLAIGAFYWQRNHCLPLSWAAPFVVLHFFLFCNVFRVRRAYELTWALLFLINAGVHTALGYDSVLHCLVWQSPVTVSVIVAEMMSPRYHGIFARSLNGRLDQYLESRVRR